MSDERTNSTLPSFGLRHHLRESDFSQLSGPLLRNGYEYHGRGIGVEAISLDDFSVFPMILVPELTWQDVEPGLAFMTVLVAEGTAHDVSVSRRLRRRSFRAVLMPDGRGRLYIGEALKALMGT